MIWYLPIEPMEERYSAQMIRWVTASLLRTGLPFRIIEPDLPRAQIVSGEFLDDAFTFKYKAHQIAMMADAFSAEQVSDGDVVLLGDAWFPGIEAIRTMSELRGLSIDLCGWHYAGMFDPDDYFSKTLGSWAFDWERHLLNDVMDHICIGGVAHKKLLEAAGVFGTHPLGLAWCSEDVSRYRVADSEKKKVIIFPHRVAEEKGWRDFVRAKDRLILPDWRWVVSSNREITLPDEMIDAGIELVVHKTKHDYYTFLGQCRIWFSAARQETFGYSLHEAIAAGVPVVAPGRASYLEMLMDDSRFLYDDDDRCDELMMEQAYSPITVPYVYTSRFDRSIDSFLSVILSK